MTTPRLAIPATIAVLIGLAHTHLLLWGWGYVGAYSPHLKWLVDLGLRGSTLRLVLLPVDFLISLALSLPAGLALASLRPRDRLRLFVALALLSHLVCVNFYLIDLTLPVPDWIFALHLRDLARDLLALLLATWLMRRSCQVLLRPA